MLQWWLSLECLLPTYLEGVRGSHILAQLWTGSRHGLTSDRHRHELTGGGLGATRWLGCLSLWLARGGCGRVERGIM